MWETARAQLREWYIVIVGVALIAGGFFLASHQPSSTAPSSTALSSAAPSESLNPTSRRLLSPPKFHSRLIRLGLQRRPHQASIYLRPPPPLRPIARPLPILLRRRRTSTAWRKR
jgi:hypothetical protein